MAVHFRDQTFDGFWRQIPDGYDGAVFENCRAQSVILGSIMDAVEVGRTTIRDLEIRQCTANHLAVGPLILENCHFDRLKTGRHPLHFNGTAFKDCRFTGTCGRIMIHDASEDALSFRHWNDEIVADNDRIYSDVQVAIDISEATFSDFDARGIRGEFIKVNNENQFIFDYAAVESFLQSPPRDVAECDLRRLRIWREFNESTRYNFVMHVSPKTRAKNLLQQFEALIKLAKANGLLLALC